MDTFPKLNFHHNPTSFIHNHVLDENERDINTQIFITFGVKSAMLIWNSSAVQLMMFNIDVQCLHCFVWEHHPWNFKETFWIALTLATNYFSILHCPLNNTGFTSLNGKIFNLYYNLYLSSIYIDNCNNQCKSLHGEETSTWLKTLIIHTI